MVPIEFQQSENHPSRTVFPEALKKIPGYTYDPSTLPPVVKGSESKKLVNMDEATLKETGMSESQKKTSTSLKETLEQEKEQSSESLKKDTKWAGETWQQDKEKVSESMKQETKSV